jgi:hypothetical protein
MVINLDKSNKEGSHWVSVFAPNAKCVYYFDSMGNGPSDTIKTILKNKFKKIIYNNVMLQSLFSSVCGHYCIYYIYMMSLNSNNFINIIKNLKNVIDPDYYVKLFVEKLY